MKQLTLQAKTRKEIASEYGISTRTLRRWLRQQGIQLPNRLVCPKDQLLIYQCFGPPRNEFLRLI